MRLWKSGLGLRIMWVTLNEIESASLKAARNSGYAWGLAEEVGAAARWLTLRGLPFLPPLLVGVLRQMHHLESFDSARQIGSSFGPTALSRRLGPVSVLTALSDELLSVPPGSGEVSLRSLAAPVLLLPVLTQLSKRHDRALQVRWPGVVAECAGGAVVVDNASRSGLNTVCADWLTISHLAAATSEPPVNAGLRHQGAELDEPLWAELNSLANRSFVPEGETSRLRGVDTGLTDRD